MFQVHVGGLPLPVFLSRGGSGWFCEVVGRSASMVIGPFADVAEAAGVGYGLYCRSVGQTVAAFAVVKSDLGAAASRGDGGRDVVRPFFTGDADGDGRGTG